MLSGHVPECRPHHTEDQPYAQRQHSLPETSPGKSPAGWGAFNPFRGPGVLRTKLGSPLQRAGPSWPASSNTSYRDTPDNLSTDSVRPVHSSSPGAPQASLDVCEQATHEDGLSRIADDARWVSLTGWVFGRGGQIEEVCVCLSCLRPSIKSSASWLRRLSCLQRELHGRAIIWAVWTDRHSEA